MGTRTYLLAALLGAGLLATAQPGTIDLAFGAGGITQYPIGTGHDVNRDLVVLPDDRFVVVGHTYDSITGFDWFAARFLSDGGWDTTFGVNGLVRFDLLGDEDGVNAVALQPDGRLVLAGTSYDGTAMHAAVARLNSDGTLDGAFGINGVVVLPVDPVFDDNHATDVLVLPDSSLLVTGWADRDAVWTNLGGSQGLWHLFADGTPDNAFGNFAALAERDLFQDQLNDRALCCALRPDGLVAAAGGSFVNGYERMSFAHWNTDGSVPGGFSEAYYMVPSSFSSHVVEVLPLINSDQVLVGQASSDLTYVHVDATGALDPTFATNGVYRMDLGPGNTSIPAHALRTPDDHAVVVGTIYRGPEPSLYLHRIDLSTGMPDTLFGSGALVEWQISPDSSTVGTAIGMQSDGRLVVAGTYFNFAYNKPFVTRFQQDITTDLRPASTVSSVRVAPNPFQYRTTVLGTESGGTVELLDAMGRTLMHVRSAEGSTELVPPVLEAGPYLLRYRTSAGTQVVRVVRTGAP
ncbi:MAG: T9SS type A sorting domain-containing protein [Flavobacteriales bacterium]|nr:T9SS type A sorting domain-containing protein [Flavobacteriales bacterium]